MVDLSLTVALTAASTVPSIFVGLFVGFLLRGRSMTQPNTRLLILVTVAAGLTSWFFLDIMAASTYLGINQPLTSATLFLVLLFVIAFLVTVMLDPHSKPGRSYDPIFIAAIVISFHGIGEGIAIGSILSSATDPIAAIGGPLSATSFVIHKALEAFIVSVVATGLGKYAWRVIAAGSILAVPTILGAISGYLFFPNATIFFAGASGGTLWLLSTLLAKSMTLQSRFKWAVALLFGVMLMFLAGTLHSIR